MTTPEQDTEATEAFARAILAPGKASLSVEQTHKPPPDADDEMARAFFGLTEDDEA